MIESENVEFKENWRDEYLKTVCGFANGAGGSLFIGIADSGEITGIKDFGRLQEDIPNKIKNAMGITVNIHLREKNERKYLEVNVPSFQHPVSFRGRYYKRSGSTNQEMTGITLTEFLLSRFGQTWDNTSYKGFAIHDIDIGSLEYFKTLAKDRLPQIVNETDCYQILSKLNLASNGLIKRAAILLFGKNTQDHFIHAQVKIGKFTSAAELIVEDTVGGNLFQQVEQTIELLKSKYLNTSIYYEGIYRKERFEIPLPVLREALINALIHRSYLATSAIQVRLYGDCIKFFNEGCLPDSLSVDDLKTEHLSIPRNPLLADIFYKAGLIESWGMGTLQILSLCSLNDLPEAVFENSLKSFSVTIFRPDQKTDQKTDQKKANIETQILELISKNRYITLYEMSASLQKGQTAIKERIKDLKKVGKLRRMGPAKGGYWEIVGD